MSGRLLVTGAAGQLGRRVVELLRAQNAGPIVAATRDPAKLALDGVEVRRADFDDTASLEGAFAGVERALLISTDAIGKRVAQHERAIAALAKAGVKHVVYTSLPNAPSSVVSIAPEHAATERALIASGLGHTILRNNLYMDLLLFTLPNALKTGQLIDARANGKTAFVSREDCARAAAAALTARTQADRIVDVTGPEALTSDQLVAIVSEVTGKPLAHVSVPPDDFAKALVAHGLPPAQAALYKSFDVAIAKGELASVSDAVAQLTGKAPGTLRDYLQSVRASLI
ncbi:MAG TPA: SDR family oxidoreductase [Polyangiales bacterium]|nr:SDR family oxidoreductase [Polyangiales bacterium]